MQLTFQELQNALEFSLRLLRACAGVGQRGEEEVKKADQIAEMCTIGVAIYIYIYYLESQHLKCTNVF